LYPTSLYRSYINIKLVISTIDIPRGAKGAIETVEHQIRRSRGQKREQIEPAIVGYKIYPYTEAPFAPLGVWLRYYLYFQNMILLVESCCFSKRFDHRYNVDRTSIDRRIFVVATMAGYQRYAK
jgi:hypothetical protein